MSSSRFLQGLCLLAILASGTAQADIDRCRADLWAGRHSNAIPASCNNLVEGRINGDQKCAAHKIGPDKFQEEYGYPKYDMNCAEWRKQGICG